MRIALQGFLRGFFSFVVLVLAMSLSAQLSQASAQLAQANPLFTVKGVEVDVTAQSALQAQNQAFEKAQIDAFSVLAERMLSEREIDEFQVPELDIISTLVKDFEITAEKRSSVRYVATYTFRFEDKAVRQYFSGSGIEFTDVASKALLVLPFYQNNNNLSIWSPYNVWMQAWNRISGVDGLVPIAVPIGDLDDVRDISDDEALSYDDDKLRNLLKRYGAAEAVLLIAVPDVALSLVGGDEDAATGSLSVNIYRTDRSGPEYVERVLVSANAGETREAMFDRGVSEVQKFLRKDWKARTVVEVNQYNTLRVRVMYDNFQQWAITQKALDNVYGISKIVLKSLSPKEAQIDLVFQGSERRLRLALGQASFTLSEPQIETFNVNSYYQNQAPDVMYELYLNRFAPKSINNQAFERRF